ncbi:uncharacterized protein si:ch211-217g15.3 [Boleophthalmus pectinirostris]|uniref:uncharacterized protein si:ch211-217g15.3 n=1 Tax=Boleophthalmus pectinirostris TaxID=150288 RepID=UPI0024302CCE|nr:uncharacterized protein si:ch211-217g15.3 [Boleophthalmus pectinirostris]
MLRTSVLLFFVLTNGITAKPLKPLDELRNEAVQKGWVSIDDKGMASWGVEVEPPEDMDETSFDIDPNMKIWKSVEDDGKQYQMTEEDLDELQHPSTENLIKVYEEGIQDALPPAEIQVKDATDNEGIDLEYRRYTEPEEDWDELYHSDKEVDKYLAPLVVGYKGEPIEPKGEPVGHPVYTEPEKDDDDLYHGDDVSSMQLIPLEPEVMVETQARLYLEPEEDMDDVYHKDVPEMTPFNNKVYPAAVDWPTQRKYTEPEEDLDALYHN